MSPREDERLSTIGSTAGGFMTDKVGAVTGDLEIATRLLGTRVLDVRVRCAGAEEWYTVAESLISPTPALLPRSCTNTWWSI